MNRYEIVFCQDLARLSEAELLPAYLKLKKQNDSSSSEDACYTRYNYLKKRIDGRIEGCLRVSKNIDTDSEH